MTHTMRDPVCGMEVDPAKSRFTHEHAGQTYYFCCGGCQTAFKTDPAQFLDPESSAPEATPSASAEASADTWFICPMDPEVREPEPVLLPEALQIEPLSVTLLLRQSIPQLLVLRSELTLREWGPTEFQKVEQLLRPFPGFP